MSHPGDFSDEVVISDNQFEFFVMPSALTAKLLDRQTLPSLLRNFFELCVCFRKQ